MGRDVLFESDLGFTINLEYELEFLFRHFNVGTFVALVLVRGPVCQLAITALQVEAGFSDQSSQFELQHEKHVHNILWFCIANTGNMHCRLNILNRYLSKQALERSACLKCRLIVTGICSRSLMVTLE